ncbi:hypothetical protein HF283_09810 [Acidithiobacillus ferrooxidans]|nr:hypothetical protein [Acidithiobacillus ferridurans]MBU2824400.1 hypothetical protein [Acidithiobacillus ferrooxidans]
MIQEQKTVNIDRHAERIAELQNKRRALLAERNKPRANTAEIELHLAIVRAELQALYQWRRQQG